VINGIGSGDALQRAQQAAANRSTAGTAKVFSLVPNDMSIPATPPNEVLQALGRVQRVAKELRDQGLDVRFRVDDDSQKAKVQVVDSGGNVVRDIPVVQALDLLSGDQPLGNLRA
jgi:uncharacterized FlaG/YvyC family protein